MLSVAFFISHMESITYFDSVYACFITYSTIGFGDIDIYVSQIWFEMISHSECHSYPRIGFLLILVVKYPCLLTTTVKG